MSQLLSNQAMAAIQKIGQLGMISTVAIYPQLEDTGLDLGDDPYGSSTAFATTPSATVKGWLVGTWETKRTVHVGDINTTTVYRLRMPVGTVIDPGDKVVINNTDYFVIDAGTDQTWPEWLTCTVHRSK